MRYLKIVVTSIYLTALLFLGVMIVQGFLGIETQDTLIAETFGFLKVALATTTTIKVSETTGESFGGERFRFGKKIPNSAYEEDEREAG